MTLIARIVLFIQTYLGLHVTVESAVAELNAVVAKVEKAAALHAAEAAAQSVVATTAQANAVSAAADADRAKRVSAKLNELLG